MNANHSRNSTPLSQAAFDFGAIEAFDATSTDEETRAFRMARRTIQSTFYWPQAAHSAVPPAIRKNETGSPKRVNFEDHSRRNVLISDNAFLDKGIVIHAWAGVSLAEIELLTIEARVVVATVKTYWSTPRRLAGQPAPPRLPRRRSGHRSEDGCLRGVAHTS